jgi:CheY-like chemotaxis protein
LALRAHEKGLELNCAIAGDVPDDLVGDPSRLRQVLINLLSNSLKFTERGEVNLRVQRDPLGVNQESARLHFIVEDTGIGIPVEKQAHIFEAFAQVDGSTTRHFGGTGLGLTICRQLVQMMGGRIWVVSAPGQGSAFHFTASLGISRAAGSVERVEMGQLKGIRVLVVDDNLTNRQILEGLLASWGMKPTLAEDGRRALKILMQALEAGEPYAVVLTDSNTADSGGFRLAEDICRNPALSAATIMMLTSGGPRYDAARCRALGLAAYLTKPVGEAELLDAVLRVTGSTRVAAGVPLLTGHLLPPERRSLRILLAEDNVVNQLVASRLLQKRGHFVVTSGNGREAIERLEQEHFDLILMDVEMAEVDGYEATATIRRKEATTGAHIPIIAMTARALKGDRERCLAAGMDDYVSKPIRPEELFAAVERLLPGAARAVTFDENALRERLSGDDELMTDVIRVFLEDLPVRLAAIEAAVASRNAKALREAAHALKGAAGNLSADRLFEAAGVLERIGAESNTNAAEAASRRLSIEASNLIDVLSHHSTSAKEPCAS